MLLEINHQSNVLFDSEPTSVPKSSSILHAARNLLASGSLVSTSSPITYASPNILELKQMYQEAAAEPVPLTGSTVWWDVINRFNLGSAWRMDLQQLVKLPACPQTDKGSLAFLVDEGVAQMAVNLLPFFQNLVIKCGNRGVVVVMRISGKDVVESSWSAERSNPHQRYIVARGLDDNEMVVLRHFPALIVGKEEIVNVTGAGDSLVGTICAGITMDRKCFQSAPKLDALIHLAQEAAVLSLHSVRAVSPLLGRVAGHHR